MTDGREQFAQLAAPPNLRTCPRCNAPTEIVEYKAGGGLAFGYREHGRVRCTADDCTFEDAWSDSRPGRGLATGGDGAVRREG